MKKHSHDRRKKHSHDRRIINMDQTPVWMSIGSTGKSVDFKDVSAYLPKGINPREKISVILACDSEGEKLPPVIIIKSGKRAPPIEYINDVLVFNSPKTSMANGNRMSSWIEKLVPDKRLLILDSFRGHLTDTIKDTCDGKDIVRAVIPGGMTKYLQPLDLTVNKSFKSKVKKYYGKVAFIQSKSSSQSFISFNLDKFTKALGYCK
jgi:hypothetical protein